MFVVRNLSYAAREPRVVKFRILNLWIFDTSDLQWTDTVQVTVGKTLFSRECVMVSFVLAVSRHNRGTREKLSEKGETYVSSHTRRTLYVLNFRTPVATRARFFEGWLTLIQD